MLYLNRYKSVGEIFKRYQKVEASAHELGHALGLGHHGSAGVTSAGNPTKEGTLSDAEIAVLTEWFSVPRYR